MTGGVKSLVLVFVVYLSMASRTKPVAAFDSIETRGGQHDGLKYLLDNLFVTPAKSREAETFGLKKRLLRGRSFSSSSEEIFGRRLRFGPFFRRWGLSMADGRSDQSGSFSSESNEVGGFC